MRPADLLVVGGGPAGLATAIRARQRGLSVVVLDRRRPPIDVACGEGIMPRGVGRLADLGVDLDPEACAPFVGIRYLDGEFTAEGDFPGEAGLGVRRLALHGAMVRRAEELGVDLRWGTTVRGIISGGVESSRGRMRGRLTVAADGRNSRIRAWAGLELRSRYRRRFGIRRHFAVKPWCDRVEVHWTDGCEAYVTPIGPSEIGVALLWDGSRASFQSLLERFAMLHDRLAGATVTSRDRGAGPFGARSRSVAAGDLALVGDATGSFDPISGEGLSIAFEQAHALIDAVEADDLGQYRAACRRIRRVPVFATRLLLAIEANRAFRRIVMRALSGSEVLFHRAVELVSGDRELRLGGRGGVLGMGVELARAGVLHRAAG